MRIQFTRPKDDTFKIYSKAIQKFDGRDYSHVRFSFTARRQNVDLIYEASGDSVKFIGPEGAKFHEVVVVKEFYLDLSRDQRDQFINYFMTMCSVKYGKLQAIGIGVARVFGLKRNPFSRGKAHQVCSETVAIPLRDVLGIEFKKSLDLLTPRDIYEALEEYYGRTY